MKKLVLTSIILCISFSINAQSWWNSKKIRGNGNIITKTRTTSDYDGIAVGGSFEVILVKGKEGEISIKGEENIIPYIITEVKRGILKIRYKKNINVRSTRKLTITVPFKDIDKISLGGSGKIISKNLIKTDDLSVNIGGSGDIILQLETQNISTAIGGSGNIELSGKTDAIKCSIAGSGDVKAYELTSHSAKASIAGSGNVRITVTNKIKASIVGSGNIYYKGNPKHINSRSIGSGDVIDRN